MPQVSLDNIKLGFSVIGEKIYLYRHGRQTPGVALEKREAEEDVMKVLVKKLMYEAPNGSKMSFTIGDNSFELTLKPLAKKLSDGQLTITPFGNTLILPGNSR